MNLSEILRKQVDMSEYIEMCAHTDGSRHALRVMYQAVRTVVGHGLGMTLHQDWKKKSNEKMRTKQQRVALKKKNHST